MRQDTQRRLTKTVLDHIENETFQLSEKEYYNPVENYLDETRFESELKNVLQRVPLCVGHASELPDVGDYKTFNVGKIPVLVSRGKDGQLRAFLNVCSHRASKVACESQGNAKSFACPYHAWTFGLDGELLAIPKPEFFPNVDKKTCGLTELPLYLHEGFIYIQTSPDATRYDITEWLGEAGEDFAALDLADYDAHGQRVYNYQTNWKLAFDIFNENYHTKKTHKDTIFAVFQEALSIVDDLSPHIRCVIPKRSVASLKDTDPDTWDLIAHATVLYTVFPNTMVAVLKEHVAVWHVLPNGVDKCDLHHYTLLSKRAQRPAALVEWEKSLHVVGKVIDEDVARSHGIQDGLHGGHLKHMVFGRTEQGLAMYHQTLERYSKFADREASAAE